MDLNTLAKQIYLANVAKGFYEDNSRLVQFLIDQKAPLEMIETAEKAIVGQRLSLIVSEVSELLEGNRKDKTVKRSTYFDDAWKKTAFEISERDFKIAFEEVVKDTQEDEAADAIIRLLDFAGAYDIDIDFHVKAKLRYNSLRPHKHGKTY